MAKHDKSTRSERPRRANIACDFCRRRKMRCNGAEPQCRNCKENGKDCFYVELTKKPRPSTARITQLEEENQRLREDLSILKSQLPSANQQDKNTPDSVILSAQPLPTTRSCYSSRRSPDHSFEAQAPTPISLSEVLIAPKTFSPDKETVYHGPTSAVHDEDSISANNRKDITDSMYMPDIWVKRQLVAESAKQRQLENVNLMADKLEFDGVEPGLATHLLSIYWSRQQSLAPIVYRTTFMRDMACNGRYFSKLLLNAMYFYASKHSARMEVRNDPNDKLTAGWKYRQRALELLRQNFDRSDIPTIQALLIMSCALFSWCDEKSTSWLYAGMAFNMVIDLGINVDASRLRHRISDEEQEVRRRLFWSAYFIDKFHALYQGRPAVLQECNTNLQILFLDEHEELEPFDPLSYTLLNLADYAKLPVHSLSTFIQTCKLSVILEKILMSIYTEKSRSRDPKLLVHETESWHSELEGWRRSLTTHLDVDLSTNRCNKPLPHTICLLALYNVLIILLHRPFVSDGHLHTTTPDLALSAFITCTTAAFEIDHLLKVYSQHFCLLATPYILSYSTYVSATIHVRVAAQSEPRSAAHWALQRCLNVLGVHQTVCWAPRRAKRVIDGLVRRLGVQVEIEGQTLVESSSDLDLLWSDIDIDAIIHTFLHDQSSNESLERTSHSQSRTSGRQSVTISSQSVHPSSLPDHNGLSPRDEGALALNEDDMAFLFDPIFGLNGSAMGSFDDDFANFVLQSQDSL